MKAVKASRPVKPKPTRPAKRRRRANLQRIVIWAIIALFSLSIVGGIVVLGATIAH